MGIKSFFVSKAIWKGVRRVGQVVAGFGASSLAKYFGVDLTNEQELALVAGVTGVLESGLNFAKIKFPNQFGWL